LRHSWQVVAAVHYFATVRDQEALLGYLGEPGSVTLHPWPVIDPSRAALSRHQALASVHVAVVSAAFGAPSLIRPGDAAMSESSKAGVFNRLNWQRLSPGDEAGLIDSNISPVLFWKPGLSDDSVLRVSEIGSQADSMSAVSPEYGRWVNRVMGRVRRRGTKVWGLQGRSVRPDLDIALAVVSTIYALPGALAALEAGVPGRS
jgi:hypothetical protein